MLTVCAQGRNLTNDDQRQHASFIKYVHQVRRTAAWP